MTNDIIKSTETIEYTLETLPELLPQQARMLHFILEGDNYTDSYRKAGYSSVEFANRAAFYMISHNPLKAHLDYYSHQIAKQITPDWKVGKLRQVVENALRRANDDEPNNYDGELAIKAIAELNKMAGDYAQTTTTQINNINGSIEDVRNARLEYKKDR